MGEIPPPKREMKEDAWMDGVIKTPHYDIHPYTKRMEKDKTSYEEKVPPKKEKKETR